MITVSQAAVNWNCSQQRVRQWLNAGRIRGAVKLGRDWLIDNKADRPAVLKRGRKPPRISKGEVRP